MEILDVCCRWAGATHDALIFAKSKLCEKLDDGEFGTDSIVLGDSAYGANYYICKPLHNAQTDAERRYQYAQIKTRNIAERTFGVLKNMFPCLAIGLEYPLHKVQDIIVACCILYNKIKRESNEQNIDAILREEVEFQMNISEGLIAEQQRMQPNQQMRTQDFLINTYFNH